MRSLPILCLIYRSGRQQLSPEEQWIHQAAWQKRQSPVDDQTAKVHSHHRYSTPIDVLATDSPNLIGDSQQPQRNIDLNPAQVPRPKASNEYRRCSRHRRVRQKAKRPVETLTSYLDRMPAKPYRMRFAGQSFPVHLISLRSQSTSCKILPARVNEGPG